MISLVRKKAGKREESARILRIVLHILRVVQSLLEACLFCEKLGEIDSESIGSALDFIGIRL